MIFWSLIVLVLLSPIPFGSIYPWSYTLMATLVGAMLLAWTARRIYTRQSPPVSLRHIWFIVVPFALVVTWILLQMATFTPESWHHPLWKSASEVLKMEIPGRISVNPFETGTALVRLMTYAGIFFLSLQYCRRPDNAHRVFFAVAVAGIAYAFYGIIVQSTGSETILWYKKEMYRESLTSTFRYKNAYATYAGLGLVCTIGLLLKLVEDAAPQEAGRRERLGLILQHVASRGWILIIAAVVIPGALMLSNSRGGLISTGLALVTLFLAARFKRGRRIPFFRIIMGVTLAGLVGFIVLSGETVIERFGKPDNYGSDLDARLELYSTTRKAISDAPWTGTGYGSFAPIFGFYRTPTFSRPVLRAHNSYLEIMLELGVPAAMVLFSVIFGLGVMCFFGIINRQRDALYPAIGLSVTVLIAVHASVDFTLQVPANAATFAMLLGAGCAQLWSTRQSTAV